MVLPKRITVSLASFLLMILLGGCFVGSGDMRAAGAQEAVTTTSAPISVSQAAILIEPALIASTTIAQAQPTVLTATLLPPTPDLTGVPLHELSIATLRNATYPGSEFVFEQTLEAGSNYNRYVVSYLSDSNKIYAMMTIPWEARPATGYPVVIFNHGYIPPEQYRTTERYVAYVDAFARNGYIVIKSDYRGHGSSEGDASSAYGSAAYVIDVLNALASARLYPDADPNRIGMWGHSMGGYITLRAMVADQDIKAGVIWAGVVASYDDLFQSWFRRGTSPSPTPNGRTSWRTQLVEQYGTPDDNPAFWASLSANSYLADLTGPVQLHHGTSDDDVPFQYSVTLEEQIQMAGGSVELFLYNNDDHNIATNRDNALALSVVFFNQHVKGAYG
ncbi:MAG: S9 family peptidase [Burkholderiales bacterium]|nr:S9 family peptidase [Anaerolineae bacterium]